jgi:hypothetical protein
MCPETVKDVRIGPAYQYICIEPYDNVALRKSRPDERQLLPADMLGKDTQPVRIVFGDMLYTHRIPMPSRE